MTGSPPPNSAPRPLDNGQVERALIPVLEADLDQTRCVLLVGPYEVGKSHVAETIAWRFWRWGFRLARKRSGSLFQSYYKLAPQLSRQAHRH